MTRWPALGREPNKRFCYGRRMSDLATKIGQPPDTLVLVAMIIGLMRLIVCTQQVTAEVALQVAPDTVDVVGVVLSVVVLDQDSWAMHPVVVRLAGLETASPAEVQLGKARTLNALELLSCRTLRHAIQVHVQ